MYELLVRCMAMKGEPSLIGDRLCQGFNNNEECDFDGMDCCRPVIDDSLCHDVLCRCHLTGLNWTLFVVLFVCTKGQIMSKCFYHYEIIHFSKYIPYELPILGQPISLLGNLDLKRTLVRDPYSFMYSKVGPISVTHTVPPKKFDRFLPWKVL